MGGGSKNEHLLCTLPFPESKAIVDRIKKNHPGITITYRDLSHQDPFAKDFGIPDGTANSCYLFRGKEQ